MKKFLFVLVVGLLVLSSGFAKKIYLSFGDYNYIVDGEYYGGLSFDFEKLYSEPDSNFHSMTTSRFTYFLYESDNSDFDRALRFMVNAGYLFGYSKNVTDMLTLRIGGGIDFRAGCFFYDYPNKVEKSLTQFGMDAVATARASFNFNQFSIMADAGLRYPMIESGLESYNTPSHDYEDDYTRSFDSDLIYTLSLSARLGF